MSYARHGGPDSDSEVYVIRTIGGHIECLGCRISGEPAADGLRYGFFCATDEADMIAHLERHREQGWKVPQRAIDRLRSEAS